MVKTFEFLSGPASEVAPRLLGCIIERTINGQKVHVRIVETEAYDQSDAASHSFNGRTPRTDVMFGPPGYVYVYFTYGMHYCCNIVTGKEGEGAAVLIRAVEPLDGNEVLAKNRPVTGAELTNGPAKLCQALQIDKKLNGHNVKNAPLKLLVQPASDPSQIIRTTRIGIKKETDRQWRFYLKGNPYVSRTS